MVILDSPDGVDEVGDEQLKPCLKAPTVFLELGWSTRRPTQDNTEGIKEKPDVLFAGRRSCSAEEDLELKLVVGWIEEKRAAIWGESVW